MHTFFLQAVSQWPGTVLPRPEQGDDCRWPSQSMERKEGGREDGINKSLVKEAGMCGSRRPHRAFRLLWEEEKVNNCKTSVVWRKNDGCPRKVGFYNFSPIK